MFSKGGGLGAQAEEVEGKLMQTTSHSGGNSQISIGNVKSTDATCDIDRFFIETSGKVGKRKGYGTHGMAIVIGASVRFVVDLIC